MEDRPLAHRPAGALICLQVDAFGNECELMRRNSEIANELVTQLCRRGHDVVAAPGTEASNAAPDWSKPPAARLNIMHGLNDDAAKRERHRLAVDDEVRPK